MVKVRNGVETFSKNFNRLSSTHERYRQTDGRHVANVNKPFVKKTTVSMSTDITIYSNIIQKTALLNMLSYAQTKLCHDLTTSLIL